MHTNSDLNPRELHNPGASSSIFWTVIPYLPLKFHLIRSQLLQKGDRKVGRIIKVDATLKKKDVK